MKIFLSLVLGMVIPVFMLPSHSEACAVCFGQVGSAASKALIWGVSTLLICITGVLGSFAVFFIKLYLKSKTAQLSS